MNKTIKSIAVVLILSTISIYGFGQGVEPIVRIKSFGEKAFVLQLNDLNNESMQISLTDMDGVVLYNKNVKKQIKYAKYYNLKNLPDGNYMLELENDNSIGKYSILLANKSVTINAKSSLALALN